MMLLPPRPEAPRIALVLSIAVALLGSPAAARPLELRLPNGIRATVHSSEDILVGMTERRAGRMWLLVQPGLDYELVTDVADPAIANRGDGRFHPMPLQAVVDALGAVGLEDAGLEIQVYVLPFPRREVLDSSARDGMILLSPGVLPVNEYAVHFTVTHEVGHVYQYRWLPDEDEQGWQRYSSLRSIEDEAIYHAGGDHKDRPHEIFAEDFRFLFGGQAANYSGGIENAALPLPGEVDGLADFLRGLTGQSRTVGAPAARLAGNPDPFDPGTEFRVRLETPATDRARRSVFDARGPVVRAVYEGAPALRPLHLQWDGRAADGVRIASGFSVTRFDDRGESFPTKLVLVR
jgi:hypothetical protein